MITIRSLLILSLALCLSACGFALRGTEHALNKSFESMRLKTNGGDEAFFADVRQALKDSDIRLSGDSDNVLEIISTHLEKRTASYSSRAKSAEYELIKNINFRFLRHGKELIPSTQIQARRSYLYRETAAVGKAEEEVLLRQEMDQDLAQRILLALQRVAINKAEEVAK